jgi:mannan endo-1,4-beta-mannosidase
VLGWYPANDGPFSAQAINSLPVKPRIVNYYAPWLAPFKESFAQAASADGLITFVEMNPDSCPRTCRGGYPSLPDIAAGVYDGYLTSFGQQIAAYGHPVMVTFAHEMNGNWYPWGRGGKDNVTPAQWVAAWDHVVTVVSAAAPGLVDWVWAPNDEGGAGPVAAYWPGDEYVDTVGIDGYLRSDSATFQSVFGPTIADIRALTSRPIWIAETGLTIDAATATRLTSYVAAVRAAGIQGFLYFNNKGWTLGAAGQEALARAISSPAG